MFMKRRLIPVLLLMLAITIVFGLISCSSTPQVTQTTTISPVATSTQFPPEPTLTPTITTTPVPLAARVNDEGILLSEYEAELGRFLEVQDDAFDEQTEEEQRQIVLDDLISQTLLAQTARENGFSLDDVALQERIDDLALQIGGEDALTEWQNQNGYTAESFRIAYRRSLEAAWQRDWILDGIPNEVEQIHARQILVYDAALADDIFLQLEAGFDFESLAELYDPVTKGELGWFPRGYLFQPEIENVAFNLQPEEYSQVIETSYGYHIIQVVEREMNHTLSSNAKLVLAHQALKEWLDEKRAQSVIEILLP